MWRVAADDTSDRDDCIDVAVFCHLCGAVNQFKAARDMANGDVAACNAVFFECFDGSLQQAFSDVAVPLAYNDSEAHVGRVGNCCYFVEEVKVLS